ncbi:lasso peptide biosynthesis B2 protein [Nocardiopsis sp. NPDC006938]|uniref:lasso peptide biosynthesis B2 protein n=1 Tax=Nocardiopsis sp. NPDC006938 TaxID=3364337 RepID=UPI0036C367BF
MPTRERACLLDLGWLLVVDYDNGRTRLLPPQAAEEWQRTCIFPPVPRVAWTPSWSTHEVPLAWEPSPRAGGLAQLTAVLGVVMMSIISCVGARRKRMRRMLAVVRWSCARARCPASTTVAVETLNAVRGLGFVPGRMACLESSVATVIALALRGRSVAWHHGVRCDPIGLHSWISVNDTPVGEPVSTLRCTKLLTITSHTMEEHL